MPHNALAQEPAGIITRVAGHSARASHSHSHSHGHGGGSGIPHSRNLTVTLLAIAVAVLVGLIVLWPPHPKTHSNSGTPTHGQVTATALTGCNTSCVVTVTVRLTDGPDTGHTTDLTFVPGATDPRLQVGEHVRLARQGSDYEFADIQRQTPMLWLALVFLLVVVVVGRWRGLAAILGLIVAGVALVVFTIPALLAGESPIWVALVSGAAIALVVLPLAHGVSGRTGAALLGTLAGMVVAAGLAAVSISALHFTGTSSDEGATLQLLGSKSTVAGLLLCGAVIGGLGVLNDVTVTQASAVFELAAADPLLNRRRLIRAAMRIGRDHIASTVYSLVLAYAGAALPVLLLFAITGQAVPDVLTSDALGPEIAAGLIGATALVLVVPLTTSVAALLAGGSRPRAVPDRPRGGIRRQHGPTVTRQ